MSSEWNPTSDGKNAHQTEREKTTSRLEKISEITSEIFTWESFLNQLIKSSKLIVQLAFHELELSRA